MNIQRNIEKIEGVFARHRSPHEPSTSGINGLNKTLQLSDLVDGNVFFTNFSSTSCNETSNSLLLDLDAHSPQSTFNGVSNLNGKLSLIDSDEDDEDDLGAWTNKPKEKWEKFDTIQWLMWAGGEMGQPYNQMSPKLALPGKELVRLTKQDFIIRDPIYGEKLFDLLNKKPESEKSLPEVEEMKLASDTETSVDSEEDSSDQGSPAEPTPVQKRPRGRPRHPQRAIKKRRPKLWEFLRNLLLDPEYCPRLICWEDYENRSFRFNDPQAVAKLWGGRRTHKIQIKEMDYSKLSRAMRFHYKKNTLKPVYGHRLVYKFGPMVTGLETDCPNFDPKFCKTATKSKD